MLAHTPLQAPTARASAPACICIPAAAQQALPSSIAVLRRWLPPRLLLLLLQLLHLRARTAADRRQRGQCRRFAPSSPQSRYHRAARTIEHLTADASFQTASTSSDTTRSQLLGTAAAHTVGGRPAAAYTQASTARAVGGNMSTLYMQHRWRCKCRVAARGHRGMRCSTRTCIAIGGDNLSHLAAIHACSARSSSSRQGSSKIGCAQCRGVCGMRACAAHMQAART